MSSAKSVSVFPVRLGAVLDLPKPPGMHWRVQATQLVDYEVSVTRNLLALNNSALAKACGADGRRRTRCLVVIDSTVQALYGERLQSYFDAWRIEAHWAPTSGDEGTKSFEAVMAATAAMNRMGILRRTEKIIAVGGGVVLDVAGLAASIYRRGVPYVRIPTTLVGQIDAGIGVKTGVNHDHHKNRLGTYYAPESALIDPEFLRTLPQRHVVNGLAEIIKMALVKDAALFDLLESMVADITAEALAKHGSATGEMMSRAISGMLDELEPNLWEDDLERAVDYGHTFSPSLELLADPALLHGEAVAVDMAICVALAHNRGLMSEVDADRAIGLMRDTGLPIAHPVFTAELLDRALGDAVKHRDGLQRVPLTNGIGSAVFVNDLTSDELAKALLFIEERHGAVERTTGS